MSSLTELAIQEMSMYRRVSKKTTKLLIEQIDKDSETIQAMSEVIELIANEAGVKTGDVQGLICWAEKTKTNPQHKIKR